jgi:hypothetical protein
MYSIIYAYLTYDLIFSLIWSSLKVRQVFDLAKLKRETSFLLAITFFVFDALRAVGFYLRIR